MKKLFLFLSLFTLSIAFAQKNSLEYYVKNAPFQFGSLILPSIPEKEYNIKNFGAIGDGKTLNTNAFEKAINTISQNGGGKLIVPAGIWLTGPIELKSKINFHLEKGAVVQFSKDVHQFPIREYSKGKFDVTPPIWGNKLKDVAFTGNGIFDGAGEVWRPVKKSKVSESQWNDIIKSGGVLSDDGKIWWPSSNAKNGELTAKKLAKLPNATAIDYEIIQDYLRPNLFSLTNVENLLIDGPTFRNSPKFIINPKNITNLVIRNTNVYNPKWAQNGDGIDLSTCNNAIIFNTSVNAGDDGICMKSSGDTENGIAKLQNIIIAECIVYDAHGGFVIGSNTDGGMKNIYVSNCIFDGSDNGIRVKSNSGRGGDVSKIYIENISMKNIKDNAFIFDTSYADAPAGSSKESQDAQKTGNKIPFFHDFYISNINVTNTDNAFLFIGMKEQSIQDLYFKNINIEKSNGTVSGDYAKNIVFENVRINGSKDFKINSKLKSAIVLK